MTSIIYHCLMLCDRRLCAKCECADMCACSHVMRLHGLTGCSDKRTTLGIADLFRAGSPIGLLGIELDTRRRNRLNGVIDSCNEGGLAVSVRQSFGNCPKYIQVGACHASQEVSSISMVARTERHTAA